MTENKDIDIKYELGNTGTILADKEQIQQAIISLVLNSIEAIQDKGVIVLRTGTVGVTDQYVSNAYLVSENISIGTKYAYFEVEDDGCGMSGKIKSKMFDPFFTTKSKGRGLGLAAVLLIVKAHSGAIHVRSSMNGGTTFHVSLPFFLV